MTYLLDTNACIGYLNDANSKVAKSVARYGVQQIALCDVVKFELIYGAHRSSKPAQNLALLSRFFGTFTSFPFDTPAAEHCGRIRAQLTAAGTPIGPYDLQIAAIAVANDLTVVTHNTREFSRVTGLKIVDWQ